MSDSDRRIASLEAEIEGYKVKLIAATSDKELDRYIDLIKIRSETLNILLNEKGKLLRFLFSWALDDGFIDFYIGFKDNRMEKLLNP